MLNLPLSHFILEMLGDSSWQVDWPSAKRRQGQPFQISLLCPLQLLTTCCARWANLRCPNHTLANVATFKWYHFSTSSPVTIWIQMDCCMIFVFDLEKSFNNWRLLLVIIALPYWHGAHRSKNEADRHNHCDRQHDKTVYMIHDETLLVLKPNKCGWNCHCHRYPDWAVKKYVTPSPNKTKKTTWNHRGLMNLNKPVNLNRLKNIPPPQIRHQMQRRKRMVYGRIRGWAFGIDPECPFNKGQSSSQVVNSK